MSPLRRNKTTFAAVFCALSYFETFCYEQPVSMHNSRIFFQTLFLLNCATVALSQSYNTAAGIRVERGVGISVQQYITNGWTAEAILHTPIFTEDQGLSILAEKHRKILFRGVNLYYGPGLHYYRQKARKDDDPYQSVFGLSGIGGLELSLGRFNIAADIKPELHMSGDMAFPMSWNGAAVSLRYIIDKRERKKLRDMEVFDRFKKKKKSSRRN